MRAPVWMHQRLTDINYTDRLINQASERASKLMGQRGRAQTGRGPDCDGQTLQLSLSLSSSLSSVWINLSAVSSVAKCLWGSLARDLEREICAVTTWARTLCLICLAALKAAPRKFRAERTNLWPSKLCNESHKWRANFRLLDERANPKSKRSSRGPNGFSGAVQSSDRSSRRRLDGRQPTTSLPLISTRPFELIYFKTMK